MTLSFTVTALADEGDLYREANQYLKQGNKEFAFLRFNRIVEMHPDSKYMDEAFFRVGEYHYEQNNHLYAEREFKKHQELFPNSPYANDRTNILNNIFSTKLISKIESDIQKDDWQSAFRGFEEIAKFNLSDETSIAKLEKTKLALFEAIVLRADQAFKEENFEKALKLYNMSGSLNVQSVREKIKACLESMDFIKKRQSIGLVKFRNSWVKENERAAIISLENGDAAFNYEDYGEALSFYKEALRLNANLMTIEAKIDKCEQLLAFEKEQYEKGLVKFSGKWISIEERAKIIEEMSQSKIEESNDRIQRENKDFEKICEYAQGAVLYRLKSPGTARFSGCGKGTIKNIRIGVYKVGGLVSAENGFGGTLTNYWEVELKKDLIHGYLAVDVYLTEHY